MAIQFLCVEVAAGPHLVVIMVRTQSYAAGAFVAAASLRAAAGAEIDMMHVASSEEYLSGKVHAQSMAAKTVSCFRELVSKILTHHRHNGTLSSPQACWTVLSTPS